MSGADLNYFECPHGCPDCSACRNSKAARNLADAILVRNQRWADAKEAKAKLYAAERTISTLEARVAELTRERDRHGCVECEDQDDNDDAQGYCPEHGTEMRDRLDDAEEQFQQRDRLLETTAAKHGEALNQLAAARAERDEALSRPTLAQVEVERQSHRQALDQLRAVAAERDEAVGLLGLCQRHWGAPSIAAGDDVGPVARERAQTRERIRALLARLAPAPEKETTP